MTFGYHRFCFLGCLFVYAFVVETRGKTLTEVQALLGSSGETNGLSDPLIGASGCDVPDETDGLSSSVA